MNTTADKKHKVGRPKGQIATTFVETEFSEGLHREVYAVINNAGGTNWKASAKFLHKFEDESSLKWRGSTMKTEEIRKSNTPITGLWNKLTEEEQEQLQSFKKMPYLLRDTYDSMKMQDNLNMTVEDLEDMLSRPEYKPLNQIDWADKAISQKKIYEVVEGITAFGTEVADCFESYIEDHNKVPTMKEYVNHASKIVQRWWQKPCNKADRQGMEWCMGVEDCVKNRLIRTYTSQLVELHTQLLIKELFPKWEVHSSKALDLIQGVDLVVETKKKRMYIHIYKNTSTAMRLFKIKERRGGAKGKKKGFTPYRRNFRGDLTLAYDYNCKRYSDCTKFINGNPVFKTEWLKERLRAFDHFKQLGEEKTTKTSKLKVLETFLDKIGWEG